MSMTMAKDAGFEFFGTPALAPMSPADELFCNGRIRPTSPSPSVTHSPAHSRKHSIVLSDPQPDQFHYRYAKSETPARSSRSWEGYCRVDEEHEEGEEESSSDGISEEKAAKDIHSHHWKRWSIRNMFLPRSRSEGHALSKSHNHIPLPPPKSSGKKSSSSSANVAKSSSSANAAKDGKSKEAAKAKNTAAKNHKEVKNENKHSNKNASPHEIHYTANRAHAEEQRRKTFLPYRPGVLACLGVPYPHSVATDGLQA